MAVGDKKSNSPLDPVLVGPGCIPKIIYGAVEAASQSYNAGALVTFAISGQAVTAATAGQACGNVILGGFAVKDATGTTSADAPLYVPESNQEMLIMAGTAGTAVTVTTTLFPLLDNFDLYIDSNGYCTVDSATETYSKVKVIGYVKDVNGDYTKWLRVIPYEGSTGVTTDPCQWAGLATTVIA
jgi:hypothetical protein